MAFTPDSPFPKSRGHVIKSKDWNDTITEVQRLETAKVNRSGDGITGSLTVSGSVGVGTTAPQEKLQVGTGITFHDGGHKVIAFGWSPSTGKALQVGFPGEIRWAPNGSMSLGMDTQSRQAGATPAIGTALSVQGGNVGIGTPTPADRLDVAGNLRALTGSNPIRFTGSWSGFPDAATNQAEISNDTGTYKTLMIIGNKSAGLGRRVSIWDRLEVNGTFYTTGFAGIGVAAPEARLHVAGGDIRLEANRSFYSPGRLHVHGEELLYLLNKSGVIISRAWGGNGNLHVDGDVRLAAGGAQVFIGGNRTGPFMQLNDDLWFSDPQNGTIHVRNFNNSNWGTLVGFLNNMSSIKYKKDTSVLGETDLTHLLDDTLGTEVVRYRYKGEDEASRLRLGVITENCPDYLVGDDGESLSTAEYIAMLHGALKALAGRVAVLEK